MNGSSVKAGPVPDGRGSEGGGGEGPPNKVNVVGGGNAAGAANRTLLALDGRTVQNAPNQG